MKLKHIILSVSAVNFLIIFIYMLTLPAVVPLHVDGNLIVDAVGSVWQFLFVFSLIPVFFAVMFCIAYKEGRKLQKKDMFYFAVLLIFFGTFLTVSWYAASISGFDAGISQAITLKLGVLVCSSVASLLFIYAFLIAISPKENGFFYLTRWSHKNDNQKLKINHCAVYTFLIGAAIVFLGGIISFFTGDNLVVAFCLLGIGVLVALGGAYLFAYLINKKAEKAESVSGGFDFLSSESDRADVE